VTTTTTRPDTTRKQRTPIFIDNNDMRITTADAAWIIGCGFDGLFEAIADDELSVDERNRVSLRDVEIYAVSHYEKRNASRYWPTSYWLDTVETAKLLSLTPGLIRQLCDMGVLPFEKRPNGERLYRRQQVNVLINARLKRQLVDAR
jgi:hypothetical protein